MRLLRSLLPLLGLAAVLPVSLALAQNRPPLSADELAQCAAQVETLRAGGPRLMRQNDLLDQRRARILAGRQALDEQAATLDPADLEAWLALRERRRAYNADAERLNGEVARLRAEIEALGGVRSAYDAACARRSFDRRDLERLPAAAQAAMRAGLADIVVPMLADAALAEEAVEN